MTGLGIDFKIFPHNNRNKLVAQCQTWLGRAGTKTSLLIKVALGKSGVSLYWQHRMGYPIDLLANCSSPLPINVSVTVTYFERGWLLCGQLLCSHYWMERTYTLTTHTKHWGSIMISLDIWGQAMNFSSTSWKKKRLSNMSPSQRKYQYK